MSSIARDRLLDLTEILVELVEQGRINQDAADACLAARRGDTATLSLHPLEYLATQQLTDLLHPGRKLDLEALTVWLAQWVQLPYVRIDPLKIDVAAVTPLMSYAFAKRHKILAIAADSTCVTIASAQPFDPLSKLLLIPVIFSVLPMSFIA